MLVFDKYTENLTEIAMNAALIMQQNDMAGMVDSRALAQECVQWANDFEALYGDISWGEDQDYIESIEIYTKIKVFTLWHDNVDVTPKDYETFVNLDQRYLSFVKELWQAFGDIPMNPDTECLEGAFYVFPTGTHREQIWHWFEETFNISVADLLYGDMR